MGRRAVHRERRARRAKPRCARHCASSGARGRANREQLRRARHRARGGPGSCGGDRARRGKQRPPWCAPAARGRACSAARSDVDRSAAAREGHRGAHGARRAGAGRRGLVPHVAIRRRCDGGYTVAHGSALHHSIVPDTFRFAPKFMPAFAQEHGAIRLRFGQGLHAALSTPAPLGAGSARRRSSANECSTRRRTRACWRKCVPRSSAGSRRSPRAPFAETWGGMIESSPDVLPIISPCARPRGILRCHRIQRPRLRHRARAPGQLLAEHGHRQGSRGTPRTFSAQPLLRRLADSSGPDPMNGSCASGEGLLAGLSGDMHPGLSRC